MKRKIRAPRRKICGGSWGDYVPRYLTTTISSRTNQTLWDSYVGFRLTRKL